MPESVPDSARGEVLDALSRHMGRDKAERFSPADLNRLYLNGYTMAQDFQDAREISLEKIGLPKARIDAILAARGEHSLSPVFPSGTYCALPHLASHFCCATTCSFPLRRHRELLLRS